MPDLNGFIWWVFLSVMGVCGFLAIWVLTKIDRNQTELFNRMHNLEGRMGSLEGEHNAMMRMGGCK